jgi:hypothetical protein
MQAQSVWCPWNLPGFIQGWERAYDCILKLIE